MLFAFSMGLLMSRNFRPVKIRGAFWICSAAVAVLLVIPYVGGTKNSWMNGIYDALCTVVLFPAIVYLGASGTAGGNTTSGICRFLGDISYPVYIIHYPSMYLEERAGFPSGMACSSRSVCRKYSTGISVPEIL